MEHVKEKLVLVNRKQMVSIAREHNIIVSLGTIHRWANEPGFPLVTGQNGKFLLYSCQEFINFLISRLKRIQNEH